MNLILKIAARNLRLSPFRSLLTMGLLGFWAALWILGSSLLRDVEASMKESITGSVTGDLQVYSNQAKDDLAVFGSSFMGKTDNGSLLDFAPIRDTLMTHPNVQAFVPMGIDMALLGRGNEMDDRLDGLRHALKTQNPDLVKEQVEQVRFSLEELALELGEQQKLTSDTKEMDERLRSLARAKDPGFWAVLDEGKLQFLETKIAPLSGEKQPIYLMYMGVDMALYREHFPKARIVEGKPLDQGQRGILISKKMREDMLKNMAARLFDRIHKRTHTLGVPIKGDPDNTRWAEDLPRQYDRILSYLGPKEAQALSQKLQTVSSKPRLKDQLVAFLEVNDENFATRYDQFYQWIAPLIRLYEISPGEEIILGSYTRTGYVKTVPLKVYGIYTLDGLEDSDLAGTMNLMDLVSFRELYGQMTENDQKELALLREESGYQEIPTENLEEALFGGDSTLVTTISQTPQKPLSPIKAKDRLGDSFDPKEIQNGLAINGAVILKDKGRILETQKELEVLLKAKGFDLRVPDWQQASGMIGQFVNIIRLVLWITLGVIFLVTLVIIGNSMITSTLGRSREIGTMRALGAQKSFVLGLFLSETAIQGVVGSLLGTLGGVLLLAFLGHKGIPSMGDFMTFLFSGPKLYPKLHPDLILSTPLLVTCLATLASVYAARHGAQIRPVEAMAEKE
jgi:ABC-type lipoprotein release transport system permease subunit